jgi:hypothetical protein
MVTTYIKANCNPYVGLKKVVLLVHISLHRFLYRIQGKC